MAIPLTGSPPPAVNYDDMLTGTSSSFRGSNGNWTASGGTLTHDTTISYMWPSNNTGSLKHVTTAANQYVTCPVPGTFRSGVAYTAYFVFAVEEDAECDMTFGFGLIGTDSATLTITSNGSLESWNGGRHALVAVHWIPTATRTGVTLRVTRTVSTGTITTHLSWVKVGRDLPKSALTILYPPDTSAAAPESGMGLVAHTSGQQVRLSAGGKNNGGLVIDSSVGTAITSNSDGSTEMSSVRASHYGIRLFTTGGGAGDLQDSGVEIDVGADSPGLYLTERAAGSLQLYATAADQINQLRHRGTGGWSASDDGTVNARIDTFFQWDFTVAGALTTGANKARYFQVPDKVRIDEVRIHVGTAPTGASLIVDVNDDGTTIFTTQGNRPEIADSGTDDTSGAPDGGTAVAKNSVLTIDIDQIGSTIAGSDLTVFIRGRYIW